MRPVQNQRWRATVALPLLLCPGCRRDSPPTYRDVVVDYSDGSVELAAGTELTQVFVPNDHDLTAVEVTLSSPAGRARDCQVFFRLRAKDSTTDIVVRKRSCRDLPNKGWARFDFPPMVASGSWRLQFSIACPDGRRGEAPIAFTASVPRIYPDGKLRINNEAVPGALQFVSFHR